MLHITKSPPTPLCTCFTTVINLGNNFSIPRLIHIFPRNNFYCISATFICHPHLFKPKGFLKTTLHTLWYNPQIFMVRCSDIQVVNFCPWEYWKPIISSYGSIKSLLYCIIRIMFVPCKRWAHKSHIHESTFIENIYKGLHLIMWSNSSAYFLRLACTFIKITRTNPRRVTMIF